MSISSMSPHFNLLKARTVFHTSQYLSRNYDNNQNVAADKMVRERQGRKRERERGCGKKEGRQLIVHLPVNHS